MGLVKDEKRVRGTYGKTWARTGNIEVSREFLDKIGKMIVDIVRAEAKGEFARRGWSPKDPKGGPDVGESFWHEILGESTITIKSSFWGIAELASDEGIPERRMTWLTQEAAGWKPKPENRPYPRPKGTKKPLVVPLTTRTGEVIFRMAPLKIADAWIHPGIAKFNFMQRAMRKARKLWDKAMTEWASQVVLGGVEEALKRHG